MLRRTWSPEAKVAWKGINVNALHLEPALLRCVADAPKSKQYLERRRLRLARVDEDKVVNAGVDTQEVQRVDEGRSKAGSPRSDLSDGASDTTSDRVAGLYFWAASLPPESEDVSDDESRTSAATCHSFRLGSDAGYESVGSSTEVV